MSYGGQQDGGYGQEDEYGQGQEGGYGEEDQYGAGGDEHGQDDDQGGQQHQQGGQQHQVNGQAGGAGAAGAKGGKSHRFPHPDVAAQYYAKATAGGAGAAMEGKDDQMSAQYSQEEEQWGYEEYSAGNMQMQQHSGQGARPLGGHYNDDPHHQNVMAGLKGIHGEF